MLPIEVATGRNAMKNPISFTENKHLTFVGVNDQFLVVATENTIEIYAISDGSQVQKDDLSQPAVVIADTDSCVLYSTTNTLYSLHQIPLNDQIHRLLLECKIQDARKLLNKISDMIVQCSPLGTFSKEPSSALIWQWLKRLFEEYMKLKQSISGQAFSQLCDMFNTDDMQKIIEKIAYLLRNEKKT